MRVCDIWCFEGVPWWVRGLHVAKPLWCLFTVALGAPACIFTPKGGSQRVSQ